MKSRLQSTATIVFLVLAAATLIGCSDSSSSPTEPPSPMQSLPIATTSLSATTANALDVAIDDEYKARATYDAVIAKFGPVWPFFNIRQAETRHIEALVQLYDRYGLQALADPYAGKLGAPDSVQEACQIGVAAEIANAAIYDDLLAGVTEPDVITVFERLRAASLDQHLPAFERCS